MKSYLIVAASIAGLVVVGAASAQECQLPNGEPATCEAPKNSSQDFLVVQLPPEGGFQTCWALKGVIMRHNLVFIPRMAEPSPGFVNPFDSKMIFQPEGHYTVLVKDDEYSWRELASFAGVDYNTCLTVVGSARFHTPLR